MATIITRSTGGTAKGSILTVAELDTNFINLNAELSNHVHSAYAPINNAQFTGTTRVVSAYFSSEVDNGTVGGNVTINFSNGNKQKVTLNATTTLIFEMPGPGQYQLKLISGAYGITWSSVSKWLNSTDAPVLNTNADGNIVSIYYDGTNRIASINKIGIV